LEFHQVDPSRSLGLSLSNTHKDWDLANSEIVEATWKPPSNTRAGARSRLMHQLKHLTIRYFVDWEVIDAEGLASLNLLNPFDAKPESAETWIRQLEELNHYPPKSHRGD
jgi:hypothetical protein